MDGQRECFHQQPEECKNNNSYEPERMPKVNRIFLFLPVSVKKRFLCLDCTRPLKMVYYAGYIGYRE